ncbi:polyhydroxyalkanoic acid system family protein [Pseudoxanthomonas dokdonensis]|uniref:Polyhydroxyalkanoic acid synthase n=1 Tax=Pseudoxanthomonas dokdonensis TaxID=344882 RepID=A0A0R0CNH3_9GAMM|nr:polyhydroxyalkanoic acid system family protein [Pseudoxanthomonas dokdonensis]KRG71088.1 polyhydroxyalkanoic acid synthase [Pseudoxanthomonas dokdonensis]
MASIDIQHPHSKSPQQAREAVDEVARKLSERFDVSCQWDGDVLNFKRSGVDGCIELQPNQLHVTANLGFLLSAMKSPIESEIRRVLDEKFV